MSNLQDSFNGGQNQAKAEAKTEQWSQSIKDSTTEARDMTVNVAQSASNSAQQGKEQSAGFLQQTGDSVKNMAEEAVDTVKSTLGVGDKK